MKGNEIKRRGKDKNWKIKLNLKKKRKKRGKREK